MQVDTMTDAAFREVHEKIVVPWEGGYVNDPDDPGGETKYGISKRSYPHLDIKNLTREQANEIYYRDYWLRSKADLMPPAVAAVHYDCAINQGLADAARFLQRALQVPADGIIGKMTFAALDKCNVDDLIDEYCAIRAVDYASLNPKYHRGWFRRLIKVHDLAQKLL